MKFIKIYDDAVKALINVNNINAVTILDNGESIKFFYSTGNDLSFPFIGTELVDEIYAKAEEVLCEV